MEQIWIYSDIIQEEATPEPHMPWALASADGLYWAAITKGPS